MFLDRLVRFLIPRQTQFFGLLEELADNSGDPRGTLGISH